MPKTIDQWVDYIQTLHCREIDLTLGRVALVYQRLFEQGVSYKVISVAGTNGKGSTAELTNRIYLAAGYQVGKFTSPHIVQFNERYVINGSPVTDEDLLCAFELVESVRGDVPLTFFEFGTLLAIVLFARMAVDVAIMEVGLGGRLDAVNIIDADLSIVTNVSIDHTAWLGNSIEQIATEKIAIARPNKPCVVGMATLPDSLITYSQTHDVDLYYYQCHFSSELNIGHTDWCWRDAEHQFDDIELPFGQVGCQLINASLAIKAALLLVEMLPIDDQHIKQGIADARLLARCQVIQTEPMIILDVAHNVASVSRLAEFVASLEVTGNVFAVCGMLQDKEIADSLKCLSPIVDEWHFTTIHNKRGADARKLQSLLFAELIDKRKQSSSYVYNEVADAYLAVKRKLNNGDCLIVFGSFFVVSDIIKRELLTDLEIR